MTDLEAALLRDVQELLDRWRRSTPGGPISSVEQLWLLALEREQIVAVAYREEAIAGRVEALRVGDEARALIRQTLVWIWKDEELHEEYLRGLLLERGGADGVPGRLRTGAARSASRVGSRRPSTTVTPGPRRCAPVLPPCW